MSIYTNVSDPIDVILHVRTYFCVTIWHRYHGLVEDENQYSLITFSLGKTSLPNLQIYFRIEQIDSTLNKNLFVSIFKEAITKSYYVREKVRE